MCGGGGGQTQQTNQQNWNPAIQPLIQRGASLAQSWLSPQSEGGGGAPGAGPAVDLSQFFAAKPQDIPQLTPEQYQFIGMQEQLPNQLYTGGEETALSQLNQLTGGPVGSAPSTEEAMQSWTQNVLPQIKQMQALQGTTYGGAADEAVANSMSSALTPLLQQEISNRAAAAPEYAQISETAANRQIQNIQNAQQAANMPYQQQAQQAQANYQDYLRRYQLAQDMTLGPVMQLSPSLGGLTSTVKTSGGGGGGMFGSVICTVLHARGYLDEEIYSLDSLLGYHMGVYRPLVMRGYHKFGVPIAKLMLKSAIFSAIIAPFGVLWARKLAGGKKNRQLFLAALRFCESIA